jgi:hypothetical protein
MTSPIALPSVIDGVFDTDDPSTLPDGAENFLAYPWTLAPIKARFPQAKKIWTITTDGDPTNNLDLDGCDCETGDFTFDTASLWVANKFEEKLGNGFFYVEVANKALAAQALAGVDFSFGFPWLSPGAKITPCWLAWWRGYPFLPNGIVDTPAGPVQTGTGNVACQYYNQGKYTWDESDVLYNWAYPPAPVPTEDDMFDAITITPTKTFPKGGTFLNAGPQWIGPLDELSVIELQDNKAIIFQSKTNSVFNAKPVIPYPAS